MAQTRAKVIAFIRKRFKLSGQSKEQNFLDIMDVEEKQIYFDSSSTDWIGVEISGKIIGKAAPILFGQHPDPLFEFGLQEAKQQMEGLYKIMMKIANVALVLNQTQRIWSTYYDRGVVITDQDEKNGKAFFRVRDFPELPLIHRKKIAGFLSGVLEMVGVPKPDCCITGSNPHEWEWTATIKT